MASKRNGRDGENRRKPSQRANPAKTRRLGLEALEDRALLAVTSSLNNGLLDIALGAAADSATVSIVKPNNVNTVDIFDGTTHQQFLATNVSSLNVHGSGATGQSLTLHSAVTLGKALTVSQLASTTIDGTYQASSINVQSNQVHLNSGVLSTRKIAAGGDPTSAVSIGNSGDILISTAQIDATAASKFLANATVGFLPGNIKINANDSQNGANATASALISLASTTVSGGDVSLTANSAVAATVNNPSLNIANIGASSNATIALTGATVVAGSGNVLISANSVANTSATVLAQSSSTDTTADAAVTNTSLSSTAIAHVGGASSIQAGGVLTLNASNNTSATSIADGSAGGSNAGGASVAYANLTVDTEAFADSQATLNANQTRVTASSQTTGNTSAKSTAKAVTANSSATQSMLNQQNAKTSGGAIALAAALGVTNVNDKTLAYVASSAPINTTQDLLISSISGANVTDVADAGAAGTGGKTTGEGVAVAVGHSVESNSSYIGGSGLVTAKGISVTASNPANSPNVFAAQAISGLSKKDSTLAGAAAFEIATVGNSASLAAGSNVNPSGGDLTIKATGDTTSTAIAQPAPGANPGAAAKGMGASLAVNILTDITRAEVEDNAKVTQVGGNPAINNFNVGSTAQESMSTSATSGADPTATGTTYSGYSSAVGISLLNATTTGRIGAGTATSAAGKLSVDATHKAEVTNVTGGNAAGQGVLGAATAISLTSAQTTATTVRELAIGGDASISTHADLSTGADAVASARGGRTTSNNTADTEAASQLSFANAQALGAGAQGTNGATAPSAKTNNGGVTVAGAVALDLVTASKSEATVGADEKLTVGGALSVTSTNDTDAHAKADGSATANNAIGMGIAVAINAVSNETNKADVLGGARVKAKGVTLKSSMSQTGDATNVLDSSSTSGVSSAKTGFAGSVAINAAKLVTESVIAPTAQVDSNGSDLNINAQENTQATVNATPGLDANNAAKGIGISFGLNVVEDDTTAAIQDNGIVIGAKNISLSAGSSDTLKTTVQTGIQATNTAFGAAVGVSTLTAPTTAAIGSNSAGPINNSGNVNLFASHTGSVNTNAGGELAASAGTAIGASVALSVEKVDTTATINRGIVAGGGVSVTSQNASAGNAQAKATSKGGKADDGSQPQTAVDSESSNDLAQADSAGLAVGAAGSNGAKAPKAKSDSGGASVAGAVAINIDLSSTAISSIAPGQQINASGPVIITATNDSDSSAKADGSATTTGSTGVGVGIAIDAATGIATRAFIGSGAQVTASALTLQTGMSVAGDGVNTLSADAMSGAGAGQTGIAGALAIEVGKVVTESYIEMGARVILSGGDLNLISSEMTSSEASAVPTKDKVLGTTKGIGVSVAFNILQDDSRSEVVDTASVIGAKGVTLNDTTTDTVSTTAETGAQSTNGLALSASLAGSILNASTKARIGSDSSAGAGLTTTGNVNLSATHVDHVTTSAGGDGTGATKAIGIALGLGYEGVSTTATTDRDLTAGAITFKATSASATSTTATASATGAADAAGPGNGTNQQANATKGTLDSMATGSGVSGTDAGSSVPDAKTSNGDSVAVAGALAIDIVGHSITSATIPDGRKINATGALTLAAASDLDASSKADGSAKGTAATGVGVAVAITVVPNDSTLATIGKNDHISAHGLNLSAGMSKLNDQTNVVGASAISGASATEKAGAGALGLTVFMPTTQALIQNAPSSPGSTTVNLNGGSLNLSATEATNSTASAVPVKDSSMAKSLGVGLSFGFNIIEADTRAEVQDGALVTGSSDVSLTASSDEILTTNASAGATATGGTGVAASAAASALTSTTTARWGANSNVNASGGITIAANHHDAIRTDVGADAKGTETTVGVAVALTYEKINTVATTDSDLTAGGAVMLSSHNASATEATAIASATGAADKSAGGSNTGAKDAGDATKSSLNTNAKSASPNAQGVDPNASVPDTKTSNGDSIAVAGALAIDLPVQIHATASIPDGRHVTTGGSLTLDATNDVDAMSTADGTAKGDATTGVGVAVAITVVPDVLTAANIGRNDTIDAKGVSLSAGMSNANDGVNNVGAAAMSGASASDKAGAGALGFSLFLPKTQAIIGSNAQVNAELGDISATASEVTHSMVSAAPSVDKVKGKSIGVGLSFGINIVETSTLAVIENGVVLDGPGNFKPHNVELSATSNDTLDTSASSGAAATGDPSAKAVSASVGVAVLNALTEATIGSGSTLATTGSIKLAATHADHLTTTVGADATADNTAVGISIGFTYEDIGTITTTNRDLNAGGAIAFASHNDSNSQTITKASGTGGQDVGQANSQTQAQDQAKMVKSTTNQDAASASNNSAKGIDSSTDIPEAKNGDGKGVAVAGAFSLDLPNKIDVEATIPGHRVIQAGGDLSLEALNHVNASSMADGTAVTQGSTGVGVAIAMTLAPSDQTIATIGDHDTITAKGMLLKAGMINGLTNVIQANATSGASASEKAGSGAFAFDLFLAGTHAEIGTASVVTGSGDDLGLSADESTLSIVNAKPSISNGQGGGGGGSTHEGGTITGVGVAVALNIVQVNTHSEIDPSVTIGGFHDTSLNALSADSLITKAQAGISLGNAASSDVYGAEFAVSFLKAQTYSQVDGSGVLGTGHDILINAKHSDSVLTTADGFGNGTGDAVGMAVAFTYDDSQTTAIALESLTAGNAISLNADNASSAQTFSISSQTGGPDANGNPQQDGVNQEGQKSRGLADSYSNEFNGSQTGATQNPSAETSNGKISVAGALSINIIGESNAIASTAPGTAIHAGGPLHVTAENDTDSSANANGSATSTGTTGVGVAIALNIAPHVTTSATIGNGSEIQAKGVVVAAGMSSQNDGVNHVGAIAKSGGSASEKSGAGGLGLSLFFPTTLAEIGTGSTVNAKQGDVAVTANSSTIAEAKAIPALLGGQTKGVGISIAIDGVEDHTTADIPKNVTLSNVAALTVTADSIDAVSSLAQAGTTAVLGGNNNGSGGAGAVAVTVLTADTLATVGTGADINASGAVNVAASHAGDTSATVTANALAAKSVVGIGVGVNVELINTTANINRNMSSVGPFTVAAHSHSNASASAAASASGADSSNAPANGVDQQTTGQRSYANSEIMNNGGQSANSSENTSAKTAQGDISLAGAVAVNIVHSHSDATIPDGLTIHANNGPLTVSAWNAGDGTAFADGTAAGQAKTGIGVAVAINSIDAEAIASVGKDTITSKGLVVEAVLGNGINDQAYSATSISGAGAKKTGIAGSVALNLVLHSKHDATIASGATIDAGGGDLTVQAISSSTDTASATPHDGGSASETGVGASVALNLLVQESHATIADNAKITNAGNFAVVAESTNTITTVAKNGAQGATAVGVSVGLTYDNNDVAAYVGKSGTTLNATGNAMVEAHAKDVATTTTDSVNIGKDTAVGVSIAVGILNTNESAILDRSLIAGGSVDVTTTDTATSATKGTAAAVGTPVLPNSASSDQATSNQTNYADSVTGQNSSSSTPSLGGSEMSADSSSTSNGNTSSSTKVAVAAVIAVDVVLAEMKAEIAPNLTVHGGGAVHIGTTSETDSSAEADGVALAIGTDTTAATASVAVNAAIIHNHVNVGNGDNISGNGISIYANENQGQSNDFAAQALAGSGSTGGGAGAGSAAVNVITLDTITNVGLVTLNSSAGLDVSAENPMTLKNFAGALSLSKDSGAGIAIGINLVLEHYTEATIANGSTIDAVNATHVTSTAGITPKGDLPENLMSLAVGIAGSTDSAVGGSTIVDFFDEKTFAQIGDNTKVNKTAVGGLNQSVIVAATDTLTVRNAAGGLAGAGGSGVGIGVIVDVINVDSHATIGSGTTINAGGDVSAIATSNDQIFGLCLVAGLASDNAVSVSVTVFVPDYETHASIGSNDTVVAGGNVIVGANHDLKAELFGGSLAIGGSNGFGAQVVTMPLHETTEAYIGHDTSVLAHGLTPSANVSTGTKDNNGKIINHSVSGVSVSAVAFNDVTTVAVGGAVSGGVSLSGSVVVDDQHVNTLAHIDHGSVIFATKGQPAAGPSIFVFAANPSTITSLAGAIAGGSSAGIGLGVDIALVSKDTEAYSDAGIMAADSDVIIKALSSEAVTSITGSITVGGSAAIGGSASIYVFDITTRAFFGYDASDPTAVKTTNTGVAFGNFQVGARESSSFIQIAGNVAVGGTASVGAGAVVPVVTKHTEAFIGQDASVAALGFGNAVEADTGRYNVSFGVATYPSSIAGASPSSQHRDDIDGKNGTTPNNRLDGRRSADFETAPVHGVVVTAVNRDDLILVGANAGIAGTAAVNATGAINVITNTTKAHIDKDAVINTLAVQSSPDQSVVVASGNDLSVVAIAAGLSVSGTASIALSGTVLVANETSIAAIDDGANVIAKRDIVVQAHTSDDILTVAASVAGAGGVSGSVAASVVVLNDTTHAFIGNLATTDAGGAKANAGGNIVIAASDDTNTLSIAGGLAVGGLGGMSASVGVTVMNKDTQAFAGDHSTIDAAGNSSALTVSDGTNIKGVFGTNSNFHGLDIEATSSENIFQLGASGAGGFYVGIAGGVAIELITANTNAFIGKVAHINEHPQTPDRHTPFSVEVTAEDTVKDFSLGGGVGVGVVGIAGGIDVGILRNNTSAFIDNGTDVRASGDINIYGLSSEDIQTYGISGAGGLGAVAGSVSVWSIGAQYGTSYTSDGKSGDALHSSNSNGPDEVSGATSSTDGAGSQFQSVGDVYLDPAMNPGLSHTKTYGTAHTKSHDSISANAGGGQVKSAVVPHSFDSGTSAKIRNDVTLNAGHDINIKAHDHLSLSVADGTVAVGFVGLGGAVAVVTLDNQVYASMGTNDVIDARGDVNLQSVFDDNVTVFVLAGSGGIVAGGAEVAVIHDDSIQEAAIGAGTAIERASNVTVEALAIRTMHADTVAVQGGGLAVGVTYLELTQAGHTTATIADEVQIGAAFNKSVTGGVLVIAGASNKIDDQGFGFSVGFIAGSVDHANLSITPTISAKVGKNVTMIVGGSVIVDSFSFADANAQMLNIAGGAASFNVMIADANVSPLISSTVGAGSNLQAGGAIDVTSSHNYDANGKATTLGAHTKATAPGGGVLTGTGVATTSNANASTIVSIAPTASLSAGTDVTLSTKLANNADANSLSASASVLGVGVSLSHATANGSAITGLGGDILGASTIHITSDTTNNATASSTAIGFGAATVEGGLAKAIASPTNGVLIGGLLTTSFVSANSNIQIAATDVSNAKADGLTVSIGGLFSAGLVHAEAQNNPTVTALVQQGSKVGSSFGSLTINASHNSRGVGGATATSFAPGGGLLSGNGSESVADASAKVTAKVGRNAVLDAGGSIVIGANSFNVSLGSSKAATFGLIGGVGTVDSETNSSGTTFAYLDGYVVRGDSLTVVSGSTDKATSTAAATGGGLLFGGNGAVANATVSPKIAARIGDGTFPPANFATVDGNILLDSHSITAAEAHATTTTGSGFVGIGISTANAISTPTITTTVGDFTKLTSNKGSVTIQSVHNAANQMDALATTQAPATFGGFVAGTGMAPTAISTPITSTTVGDRTIIVALQDVDVSSTNTMKASADCDSTSISAGVSVGAGVAKATANGSTTTLVRGIIGSANNVTIEAHGQGTANAHGNATAIGILGGAAGVSATSTVDSSTLALLGDKKSSGSINARNDVSILADDHTQSTAFSQTTAGGVVGIGISTADSTAKPTVGAVLSSGSITTKGNVAIHAVLNLNSGEDTAKSTAQSPGGGLISGNGAVTHATASPNVYAGSDLNTTINAKGDVDVLADSHTIADAISKAETISLLLGIGASEVKADVETNTNALVLGKTTDARSLTINAKSLDRAFTEGEAAGGSAINLVGVSAKSLVNPTTNAQLGADNATSTSLLSGDATVAADENAYGTSTGGVLSASIVGVGIVTTETDVTPGVTAKIGHGTEVIANNLTVSSLFHSSKHETQATSNATEGALFAAVTSTSATVKLTPVVLASIDPGAIVGLAGDLTVKSNSINLAKAEAGSQTFSGIAGGGGVSASTTLRGSSKAIATGLKTLLAGGQIHIDAEDNSNVTAYTNSLAGGILGAFSAADSEVNSKRTVEAHLGAVNTIFGNVAATVQANAVEIGYSESDGVDVSGGIGAGTSEAVTTLKTTVIAKVDDNTAINTNGAFLVAANGSNLTNGYASASGGGGLAGGDGSDAIMEGTLDVEALLGKAVTVHAAKIDIGAESANDSNGNADGSAGGLFAGVGSQVAQTDLYSTTIAKSDDSSTLHKGGLNSTGDIDLHAHGEASGSSLTTGGSGGFVGAGGASNSFIVHSPYVLAAIGNNTQINAGGVLSVIGSDTLLPRSSTSAGALAIGGVATQGASSQSKITNEEVDANLGENVIGSAASLIVHASQANVLSYSEADATATAPIGVVANSNASSEADVKTYSHVHIMSGTNLTLTNQIDLNAFGPNNVYTDSEASASSAGISIPIASATAGSVRYTDCCVTIDPGVTMSAASISILSGASPALSSTDNYTRNSSETFEFITLDGSTTGSNTNELPCIENDGTFKLTNKGKKKAHIGKDGGVDQLVDIILLDANGNPIEGRISGPVTVQSLRTTVDPGRFVMRATGGTTSGHSTIEYDPSTDLEIVNDSPYPLTIGNINTYDNPAPAITHEALDGEALWSFDLIAGKGSSTLNVSNTNSRPTDLVIQGPIFAPGSDVMFSTAAGCIFGAPTSTSLGRVSPNFLVRSLGLEAPFGTIGTSSAAISPQFAIDPNAAGGFSDVTGLTGVYLNPTFAGLSDTTDFSLGNIHAHSGPVSIRVNDGQKLSLINRDGIRAVFTAMSSTFHIGNIDSGESNVVIVFSPTETLMQDVSLEGAITARRGLAAIIDSRGQIYSGDEKQQLIEAARITLNAMSVGTADSPILVAIDPSSILTSSETGLLIGLSGVATTGDFFARSARGQMIVGRVQSLGGSVGLDMVDNGIPGEDLILPGHASITALRGHVTLTAAEDVSIAQTAMITAADIVTITGGTHGSVMELDGAISAKQVNIEAGGGDTSVALRQVLAGTTVMLCTNESNATYYIGSAAVASTSDRSPVPTKNGGDLSTIQGSLVIEGNERHSKGVGHTRLVIEDDGDRLTRTVSVDANALIGLLDLPRNTDLAPSPIQYSNIDVLDVILGSGNNVIGLRSIDPSTETTIEAGSGDDTFNIGQIGKMNEGVPLPLILGGLGNDTVHAADSINFWELTGLNAGTVTGDNGFRFSSIENLIGGSLDDLFAFENRSGVDGSIDGGAGINTLDYSQYQAPISVTLREGTATGVGRRIANISKVISPKS